MEALRVTPEIHPSWFQPRTMERSFELRDGERLLGTLHFPRFGGSLATASFTAGEWTFKRVGFFRPRVTVRPSGQEVDLAVYRPKGWGSEGELQFVGGHSYGWKPANFWATRYAFVDDAERAVVTFKPGAEEGKWSDLFKYQALVEIDPSVYDREELPILVSLGWYLMILHHDDSAGAAVVATMG